MTSSDNIINLVPATQRHHEKQLAELLSRTPNAEAPSFHCLGNGYVLVVVASDVGEISYMMSTGTFMNSITSAVAVMNQNLPLFLKVLGGF